MRNVNKEILLFHKLKQIENNRNVAIYQVFLKKTKNFSEYILEYILRPYIEVYKPQQYHFYGIYMDNLLEEIITISQIKYKMNIYEFIINISLELNEKEKIQALTHYKNINRKNKIPIYDNHPAISLIFSRCHNIQDKLKYEYILEFNSHI